MYPRVSSALAPRTMEDHSNAQQIHMVIQQRVETYNVLFLDRMTPLLKKEVRHAVKVHTEILNLATPKTSKRSHVLDQLGDLDTLHDHLTEHWAKVHGDLVLRSSLLTDIALFQVFLAEKLLQDYTGKLIEPTPWALNQASLVELHSTGAADSGRTNADAAYDRHIDFPLQEMMLDPGHAAEKLRTLTRQPKHPGGDIQQLIDQCDWPSLATTLVNDRALAAELFQQAPIDPDAFDANTSKKVLRGMDEIAAKYFTELASPSNYTLSRLAIQRSAKRSSGAADTMSPDVVSYAEEPSLVAGAKEIYGRLANGLGLSGMSSNLRSLAHNVSSISLDEKARLFDDRKKTE